MNPTSDIGWWIANLVFGATTPDGGSADSRLPAVQQVMISVRCTHWREAFWKARRAGLDRETSECITVEINGNEVLREVRWQFVGITSLAPLPSEMTDSAILSSLMVPDRWLSLRELWEMCVEDYSLEKRMAERALLEKMEASPAIKSPPPKAAMPRRSPHFACSCAGDSAGG